MLDSITKGVSFLGKHYFSITGTALWLTSLLYFNQDGVFWTLIVGATLMWGLGFIFKAISNMG